MKSEQLGVTFKDGDDLNTAIDTINDHGQRCRGTLGVPGTEKDAYAYKMECTLCGYVYGSNGGDVRERKCPNCQEGAPGIRFWLIARKIPVGAANGGSQETRVERVAVETGADWIARISGSLKDIPGAEEMIRLGREFREADRPPDDADER